MSKQETAVKVSLVTLGCSKNLVDAECMSSILEIEGFILVPSFDLADIIVINTCGFIEQAKKEAIDMILEASEFKSPKGKVSNIVVTGCLSQRYPDEILSELPEVDAVLGTAHYQDIARVIRSLLENSGEPIKSCVTEAGGLSHLKWDRKVSTFPYAWLKIAEGCSNSCAYCAIPLIRGPFRSRPFEDIIAEAEYLARKGFGEIILTAQDTTSYGKDLYGKIRLPELLRALSSIEGVHSVRIMYAYIDGITEELIEEMKQNPKIMHYLDIPVQHGDDRVLSRMGRRDRVRTISSVIEMLRKEIPDIILRSTVIVGFPGETEEEFQNLLSMISTWRFDRLGCFTYSSEDGTRASLMTDPVPPETAEKRYQQLMTLQSDISLRMNEARMDSIVTVTIDSVSEDGIFYIGRSYGEAPEVDPVIMVLATSSILELGDRYRVRIVECSAYDMTGVTIDEYSQ